MAEFGRAIEQVAEQLDLATRWINDGAKAYGEVLPADFDNRLTEIGRVGHLSVLASRWPEPPREALAPQ